MTKARRAAFKVLQEAERPLSAGEIHERIEIVCDPATVYRTLHYLEENNYTESFVLHCREHGTERYYTAPEKSATTCCHHHWFHCEQCHKFIDLGDCRIEPLIESYQKDFGLTVTGHTLYLTGLCPECASRIGT